MTALFDFLSAYAYIFVVASWAPFGFILVAAWFYSRALLKGLASARDEQHRLTPQSPWFYFDREYEPRARRIGWWLFGVIAGDLVFNLIIYGYGGIRYKAGVVDILQREIQILLHFLFCLGCAGAIGGWLAWIAPQFKSPWTLAMAGSLPGFVIIACLLFLVLPSVATFSWRMPAVIEGVCAGLGANAYKVAWRDIRARPKHAWFRFQA